jgi:hypothetical protein
MEELLKSLNEIARCLGVIAAQQERLVELAELDLENVITHEVEHRAESLANEISLEKTKRSFIGRKKNDL